MAHDLVLINLPDLSSTSMDDFKLKETTKSNESELIKATKKILKKLDEYLNDDKISISRVSFID